MFIISVSTKTELIVTSIMECEETDVKVVISSTNC